MGPGFRRDVGLFLWGVADHGDHRVTDVFDPFRQYPGFDRREAGVLEIALDEGGVALVVEGAPDRDGLGPEAAVRKADHERRAGPQRASHFTHHRHRPLPILSRDADRRGIEAGIGEWQFRVAIEVLDKPAAEARVGGQLLGIHAVAYYLRVLDFGRQV